MLLVLDGSGNFVNFVSGHGALVVVGRACVFDDNHEGIMVTIEIGGHKVRMYDAIDELPIARFHRYQRSLLVDAGVGSDMVAFDQRIERARRFLMAGDNEKAGRELENLRQSVFLIQSSVDTKLLSFAALVVEVDGKPCDDLSDDGLRKVCGMLEDSPRGEMTARLEAVKKKIDDELQLYFPAIFNDANVKEYYDILRRRSLAILRSIINGEEMPGKTDEVDKLTTALITYSKPQAFSGPEGVEVQFDRQFENLCLVLSEQVHVSSKNLTVLEFYNAFDFVRERARQAEKGQKRAV